MNKMNFKSYTAQIEFDDEDRIFVGRLVGIEDIVVFHGSTVDELETAFHESVEHYLAVSKRTGIPANKPSFGDLTLRVTSNVFSAIETAAESSGKGVQQWASDVLIHAAQD